MRFLVDRCAGRKLADWLTASGHDVVESRVLGEDPGDEALLEMAAAQARILVTIDTDFAKLVYVHASAHCGIVRLSNVPAEERIHLMQVVLDRYGDALKEGRIITVRGTRVRVSAPIP